MRNPCGPAAVMEEHTSLTKVSNVTEKSGRLEYVLKPEPEDLPHYRILHKATVNGWCRKEAQLEFFYYAFMLFCVKGIFFTQNHKYFSYSMAKS